MGTMTRRLRRNERRRVGALVDLLLDWLDYLDDEAYDQRDVEAHAWCEQAADWLEASLASDGRPTDATMGVLLEVIAGPVARAMARLRPDLPLPPGAQLLESLEAAAE
jgi:hypothetical protein